MANPERWTIQTAYIYTLKYRHHCIICAVLLVFVRSVGIHWESSSDDELCRPLPVTCGPVQPPLQCCCLCPVVIPRPLMVSTVLQDLCSADCSSVFFSSFLSFFCFLKKICTVLLLYMRANCVCDYEPLPRLLGWTSSVRLIAAHSFPRLFLTEVCDGSIDKWKMSSVRLPRRPNLGQKKKAFLNAFLPPPCNKGGWQRQKDPVSLVKCKNRH